MEKTAIYPGTFDPITNGHIDVIRKALLIVEKIIIAIPEKNVKEPYFPIKERIRLVKESTKNMNIDVVAFQGLIAEFAKKIKCRLLVKGVRGKSDIDYEIQMVYRNSKINPDLHTIFIPCSEEYAYISSSLVKEIACSGHKKSLGDMVPECVEKTLRSTFRK